MEKYRYRVDIIESESGWGQRVDGTKFWDEKDLDKAEKFVEDYNKSNNLDHVPGWYMYATSPVRVMVDS